MEMHNLTTHNIVLTGVPRGGTTLSCHLLNKVADTVALHEPIVWNRSTAEPDHVAVCAEIHAFFRQTRTSLLRTKSAISQQHNGSVPDNPMGGYPIWARWMPKALLAYPWLRRFGLRTYRVSRDRVEITKALSDDFTLCIKHTGPFTALLPRLLQQYRCYAIIRNPLAVLLSWNSINFALREGHMLEAEWLDPTLAQHLARIPDRFDRQIVLLSWFFAQYEQTLPAGNVIRYEEIIASGGAALQAVAPGAGGLQEPLTSKNQNKLYDQALLPLIAQKLLHADGAFWKYYTRESVETLRATLAQHTNQIGAIHHD